MASIMRRRKSSVFSYRLSQYSDRCSWMRNEKFLRELEGDNIDAEIISEELRCLQDTEPVRCRGKLVKFLESNPWQVVMCSLVLVDAIVVVVEILLELNAMRNQYLYATTDLLYAASILRQVYDEQVPADTTDQTTESRGYSDLDQGGSEYSNGDHFEYVSIETLEHDVIGDGRNLLSHGNQTKLALASQLIASVIEIGHQLAHRMHLTFEANSIAEGRHPTLGAALVAESRDESADSVPSQSKRMFEAAHVFHLCSIGILGIFVVQVFVKVYGMGKVFFKKKMELFDAIIIVASFALDLVFVDGITGVQGEEALALIIIFLLWRVLRVINGLMVAAERRQEFRVKLQKRARRRAEKRIEYLEDEKNWKEREVVNLRQLCWEKGASEDQIAVCKPMRRSVYQKMDTSTGLSSIASLSLVVSMSMSGSGSRAMLARSAAGLIPAMAATAVSSRHRRSSGSTGSRSSCGPIPVSTSSSTGAASAIHYEQRRAPSATPPRRHRTQFIGTIDETAVSAAGESSSSGTTQTTVVPNSIGPGVAATVDDVKTRKLSPILRRPDVEIVVHPDRSAKAANEVEGTTNTLSQSDVSTTGTGSVLLMQSSRSDNTLRNVSVVTSSLVAIANGFIHTT